MDYKDNEAMFEEIADEAFIEERPDSEAMIEEVSDDKIRIQQLQDRNNDLETNVKQLQGEIKDLQREKKNLQREKKNLQEEKRNLEDEINTLEDEINTISRTRRNHPLPIVLCILFGLVAAFMSVLLLANSSEESVLGDSGSIATENAELKNRVSSLASQLEASSIRINELEAQITRLNKNKQKEGNAPSNKEKELENQLKNANTVNENLRKENQRLQNGLDAALNELRNKKKMN